MIDLNVDDHLKDLTRQALERTRGSRKTAAKLLGVSIRTLRNWIHKYHLKDSVPAPRSGPRPPQK